jgi:hypothetical protein
VLIQRTGRYRIELWGAQGGPANSSKVGGKGGYTKGEINLNAGTTLYVYIGGARVSTAQNSSAGSYNGGGNGLSTSYGSGGGATDVRTVPVAAGVEPSSNAASLASRIMVAAGGGGANGTGGDGTANNGGYAGGLTGGSGNGYTRPNGGNQEAGGNANNTQQGGQNGSFGKGGSITESGTESAGGGGGGWFGGGSGNYNNSNSSGAGGSSYISGFSGCTGTSSTTGFTARTGDALEKSKSSTGLFFIAGTMSIIAGNAAMPKPDGSGNETGHEGPGFARITFISE